MKTYSAKAADIEQKWYIVDAQGKTLGRLSSEIASVLRGKHKPIFTPHIDCGDHVIVINAEKVHVTGMKMHQKKYYRHSGYPGGLREIALKDQLEKFPNRVIEAAVKGMLPKNRLGRKIYKKLRVYAGPSHPHAAQNPEVLEL